VDQLSPDHNSLAQAIRALSCPIATTNYDCLLEECLDRLPVNLLDEAAMLRDRAKNSVDQKIPTLDLQNHSDRYVYHLHGTYYDRNGFTLSSSDYKNQSKTFEETMYMLLEKKRMLFIGMGLGLFDEHFAPLLSKLQNQNDDRKHFCLVPQDRVLLIRGELEKKSITNVAVISYGEKYKDLTAFLWKLVSKAPFNLKSIRTTTELFSFGEGKDRKKATNKVQTKTTTITVQENPQSTFVLQGSASIDPVQMVKTSVSFVFDTEKEPPLPTFKCTKPFNDAREYRKSLSYSAPHHSDEFTHDNQEFKDLRGSSFP